MIKSTNPRHSSGVDVVVPESSRIAQGARASAPWLTVRPSPDAESEAPASLALSVEARTRFRAMVDEHHPVVWRFLRGLGVPRSAVDDAAQHVFFVAAQRLDGIAHGSERAFLFATARGIAANARRAVARVREVGDEPALLARADDREDPEEVASTNQARKLLDSFLEGLEEDVRTVFVLFELEGMTMAAIAEALELPPGTVASRLRRGREDFRAAAKRLQAQRGRQP